MANSPKAAPVGTRRAIAVIAGALNEIDEKRKNKNIERWCRRVGL